MRKVCYAVLLSFVMPLQAHAELALNDPTAAVEAWVRLKGDSEGKVTYEWVSGFAYGIPFESASRALFRIESVTIRQFRKKAPGHYTEQTYSCRLYRDVADEAFIDRWLNPYSRETVDLKPGCGAGPTIRYSPDSVDLVSDIPFTSTALGRPMQLHVVDAGDHYIIRRQAHSVFTASPDAAPRRETSEDTFTVAANVVNDKQRTHWLPTYHWSSVTHWMRSLGMPENTGRMLWSIDGRNFLSIDALPQDFRQAVEARQPGALAHRFQWE